MHAFHPFDTTAVPLPTSLEKPPACPELKLNYTCPVNSQTMRRIAPASTKSAPTKKTAASGNTAAETPASLQWQVLCQSLFAAFGSVWMSLAFKDVQLDTGKGQWFGQAVWEQFFAAQTPFVAALPRIIFFLNGLASNALGLRFFIQANASARSAVEVSAFGLGINFLLSTVLERVLVGRKGAGSGSEDTDSGGLFALGEELLAGSSLGENLGFAGAGGLDDVRQLASTRRAQYRETLAKLKGATDAQKVQAAGTEITDPNLDRFGRTVAQLQSEEAAASASSASSSLSTSSSWLFFLFGVVLILAGVHVIGVAVRWADRVAETLEKSSSRGRSGSRKRSGSRSRSRTPATKKQKKKTQ